jgi:hypothetical protein
MTTTCLRVGLVPVHADLVEEVLRPRLPGVVFLVPAGPWFAVKHEIQTCTSHVHVKMPTHFVASELH